MRQLTREQAAREKGVSLRTMDRWISEGVVEVETFMEGQRRRVMVRLDDDEPASSQVPIATAEPDEEPVRASTVPAELAVSRERIHGLKEQVAALQQLVDTLREQKGSEERRHSEREGSLEQLVETLREQRAAEEKMHDEQVVGLHELVGVLKEQNVMEQSRYSQLYHDVVSGTLALPEGRNLHRPWWRFWIRGPA